MYVNPLNAVYQLGFTKERGTMQDTQMCKKSQDRLMMIRKYAEGVCTIRAAESSPKSGAYCTACASPYQEAHGSAVQC